MKTMFMGIVLLLLTTAFVFGCMQQPEEEIAEEAEEIPEIPEKESLISVSGDEDVSVVKIRAEQVGAKWQFPVDEYEDEFIDVGLHSDSFIRLNNSHVKFLDDEEAIWIHPMIQSGNRTVLFNAIYSREVENCSDEIVTILGKDYEMSRLKDGESFEFDDKWKVGLVQEEGCTSRIVVYLDGYFYDLGNDEQINLIRNDNTVLFKFSNLESEPYVAVIGTKPVEDFQKA